MGFASQRQEAGEKPFKKPAAFECHTYPDTGHWFFEDDRADAFEPQASALAWTRTLDFLNRKID